MTDANLMEADCIHGVTWYDCTKCATMNTPTVLDALVDRDHFGYRIATNEDNLRRRLQAIDVDPEMPVAVLRALLDEAAYVDEIVPEFEDDPVAMRLGFTPAKPGVLLPATPEHCHDCALKEVARLRALLAEHNTPTPDPPTLTRRDVELARQYSDMAQRLDPVDMPDYDDPAVPVQEPTCTTCGGAGWFVVASTRGEWQTDTLPCPVCAVPNPESSPQ